MVLEYNIIENEVKLDFIKEVNIEIDQGWEPLGGICTTGPTIKHGEPCVSILIYSQAMIREKRQRCL